MKDQATSNRRYQLIPCGKRFNNLHQPVTWIWLLVSPNKAKRFQNLHVSTNGFSITLEYKGEIRNGPWLSPNS